MKEGATNERPRPQRPREVVTGYYRIEIVAERVGLSPARIRAYEEAGLVQPARVQGRLRLYGDEDLARLRRLRRLAVQLGLTASGVEVVARLLDQIDSLRADIRSLRELSDESGGK